jgi:hypothetical protein
MDGSVVIGRRNSIKRMLLHGIDTADVMTELGALDKLHADWDNLTQLMKVGRASRHPHREQFRSPRDEPTVDIREEYL